MIWRQASELNPPLQSPTTMSWRMETGQLVLILTSLVPIPDVCHMEAERGVFHKGVWQESKSDVHWGLQVFR